MAVESSREPRRRRDEGAGNLASTAETMEMLDGLLRELDEEGPATAKESPKSTADEGAPEPVEPLPEPPALIEEAEPELGPEGSVALSGSRSDPSLELARAEAEALKRGLARQQAIELELRRELADLRGQITQLQGRIEQLNGRFVPAAPVAFLAADGKSVARKAFYALGRGEALESYLSALLATWKGTGRPLQATCDPDGVTVELEGDPDRRSIRHLCSGVYLIQLSPSELEHLAELPPLVRVRRADGKPLGG